jgi:hypothetical protein
MFCCAQSLCHVRLSDSLISFALWRGIKASEHNNDCLCFFLQKSIFVKRLLGVCSIIQTNRKLWSFVVANENRRKGAAMKATLYFRTYNPPLRSTGTRIKELEACQRSKLFPSIQIQCR